MTGRLLLLVLYQLPAVPATPARYSRTLQGFQSHDRKSGKGDQQNQGHLLYIGRNTLPIYLFHPIFTMAAKFYHPLFAGDPSEISFAAVTVILAIIGSLLIAKVMEKTKLAYLFGKGKLLR